MRGILPSYTLLPHASPFRQGERRTRKKRRDEPPESKGRKEMGSIYLFHARARTHARGYACPNVVPYMRALARARGSPYPSLSRPPGPFPVEYKRP